MNLPEAILRQNVRPCESRDAVLVVERATFPFAGESIQRVVDAKTGKPVTRERNGRTEHLAQIGEANVLGANGRGYSDALWDQQIAFYAALMEEGRLLGASDHTGPLEAGSMKHVGIIWREAYLDREKVTPAGGIPVMGWYQFTPSTAGKDLQANKEAGACLGFSTQGYGKGRALKEEDRQQFNVPADVELTAEIEDPNTGETKRVAKFAVMTEWRLTRVDAVDDPSFVRARDKREVVDGKLLTAKELRGELVARDAAHAAITEGAGPRGSAAPDRTLTQYSVSPNGDVFGAANDSTLNPKLDAHAYRVVATMWGPRFVKMRPQTDELMNFKGSISETVVKKIAEFRSSDTREKYKKAGALHHMGMMLYGPPGTGKTATLHQSSEAIVNAGDVVFYVRSIGTLIEALGEFREVEPNRFALVCLEDADGYLGYSEREFLQLLDGEQSTNNVAFLATTNYIGRFAERMIRPGRFDEKILVPFPPREGRLAYLQFKLKAFDETQAEIDRLADETDGLSFGHLRELVLAVYARNNPVGEVLDRLKNRVGGASRRTESTAESTGSGGVTPDPRLLAQLNEGTAAAGDVPPTTETTAMKTLEDLKAAHPDIFALHEQAVASAKQPLETKLEAVSQELTVLRNGINSLIGSAKAVEGITLPTTEVKVTPDEAKAAIDGLNTEITNLKTQLVTAAEAKVAAESKVAEFTAAAAEADRRTKVGAKVDGLLKDNAFAPALRKLLEKRVADASFDEAAAEAFITEHTEAFGALKLAATTPATEGAPKDAGMVGVDVSDDELAKQEAAGKPKGRVTEAAPEAAAMAG